MAGNVKATCDDEMIGREQIFVQSEREIVRWELNKLSDGGITLMGPE